MNDAQITVIGWLAADPRYVATSTGTPLVSLRVGCTPRRFDRESGQWQDMEATFLTVNCWRGLAENVNASEMKRGDPVIVTGRLRIREYLKDEQIRFSAVVDATTIGHDLTRGTAMFRRMRRGGAASVEDRREAEELNDLWLDAAAAPADEAGPGETGPGETGPGETGPGETGPGETGPGGAESTESVEVAGVGAGYAGDGTTGDADGEAAEFDPYDVTTKAA